MVAARAIGADEAAVVTSNGPTHRVGARSTSAIASAPASTAAEARPRGHRQRLRERNKETAVIATSTAGGGSGDRPPRPFERGVRNRRTRRQRRDVRWIPRAHRAPRRGPGSAPTARRQAQGTALVTLGGAVERPGVYEIAPPAQPARATSSHRAGGLVDRPPGPPRRRLRRGMGGDAAHPRWPRALGGARSAPSRTELAVGARRPLAELGEASCGVWESARVLSWLAAESAGQCGPCLFGLRADRRRLRARWPTAAAHPGPTAPALARWGAEHVTGRGACRHPDGAARLLESALRVFADELDCHDTGRCTATQAPSMPLPIAHLEAA